MPQNWPLGADSEGVKVKNLSDGGDGNGDGQTLVACMPRMQPTVTGLKWTVMYGHRLCKTYVDAHDFASSPRLYHVHASNAFYVCMQLGPYYNYVIGHHLIGGAC